jgi:hypothetical protein
MHIDFNKNSIHFSIGKIKNTSLFEIWIGYTSNESSFEFNIEIGFYKLYIDLPKIIWFKEN